MAKKNIKNNAEMNNNSNLLFTPERKIVDKEDSTDDIDSALNKAIQELEEIVGEK